MISRRQFHSMTAVAALSASGLTHAQDPWPARPIRFVVAAGAGGASDVVGRLFAESMGKILKATIVVDNKVGGTGQIGTELVANAAPDGYTLLEGLQTVFTVLPSQRKLNFSLDSFDVIAGVASQILVFVVRDGLPVNNLREFVDFAKKNPGKLTYASPGEGSNGHPLAAIFAQKAGIDLLHVPFNGPAPSMTAVAAGVVDFLIIASIMPMVKAGRIRPLAIFYDVRHPELPDVPTAKEAGFDVPLPMAPAWSLLVPKGTPSAIVSRLYAAAHQTLSDPKAIETLRQANLVASLQSPTDYRANVAADRKLYAELLPLILKK
ncbi:MAG: tripartite tricarboxylate transporter substrate binding protein [Burkholderiaceae bacterium]